MLRIWRNPRGRARLTCARGLAWGSLQRQVALPEGRPGCRPESFVWSWRRPTGLSTAAAHSRTGMNHASRGRWCTRQSRPGVPVIPRATLAIEDWNTQSGCTRSYQARRSSPIEFVSPKCHYTPSFPSSFPSQKPLSREKKPLFRTAIVQPVRFLGR